MPIQHAIWKAGPADAEKKRLIDQRFADAHISPLWFPERDSSSVEGILQLLLD